MEKWFSRKLFVALLVVCVSSILRARGALGDWVFATLVLVSTGIYTLVNGAIKLEALKIESDKIHIDLVNDEEEDDDDDTYN